MRKYDDLVAEIKRLRSVVMDIASHHDELRELWSGDDGIVRVSEWYDADNARYHEERRNLALSHIASDAQRFSPGPTTKPREPLLLFRSRFNVCWRKKR